MDLLALTILVSILASAPAAAPSPAPSPAPALASAQDRFRPAIALHGFLDAPVFVEAADFDGDGRKDLVFGGVPPFATTSFDPSQFLQLSLNRGGTDFTLPEPLIESPRRLLGACRE